MATLLEEIEHEAMRLTYDEKEQLVADLVAGLEQAPLSEVDQAWIEEAEHRWDEFASGRTQCIPAKEVLDGIRMELGWKK